MSMYKSCVAPSSNGYSHTHACSASSKRDGCCKAVGGIRISSKNPKVTVDSKESLIRTKMIQNKILINMKKLRFEDKRFHQDKFCLKKTLFKEKKLFLRKKILFEEKKSFWGKKFFLKNILVRRNFFWGKKEREFSMGKSDYFLEKNSISNGEKWDRLTNHEHLPDCSFLFGR